MPTDDNFCSTDTDGSLCKSRASSNLQKPTIVLRAKSRAVGMSDVLDMSYAQLAALRSAPMGSILAPAKAATGARPASRRSKGSGDIR